MSAPLLRVDGLKVGFRGAAPALDRYMFSSAFSLFGRRSPPRRKRHR